MLKTSLKKYFAMLLIASQLAFCANFLLVPKPAQAIFGLGDFTFNTEVGNWYDILKDIGIGAAQRIAISYANKYLTQFVDKVVNKYRIKNYMYYERILTGYYLNQYVFDKVQDPDLRAIYGILARDINSRATVTDSSGKTQPLLVALKQKLDTYYYNRGGINSSKIYYPGSYDSDEAYFAAAQAYFSNPPNFAQNEIYGQYGQLFAEAQGAASKEIAAGSGFKNDRTNPPGVVPRVCTNQDQGPQVPEDFEPPTPEEGEEAAEEVSSTEGQLPIDEFVGPTLDGADPNSSQAACEAHGGTWSVDGTGLAQSVIQNPAGFIHSFATNGIKEIFENNFGARDNLYTTIGSLLGNYIFTKMNLIGGTSNGGGFDGTFNEKGSRYAGATGSVPMVKDLDLDGDNLPDGQDVDNDGALTSIVDTCYHGGTPPNCKTSTTVTSSPYFMPVCQALDRATLAMGIFTDFMDAHADQIKGGHKLQGAIIGGILTGGVGAVLGSTLFGGDDDNFENKADATIWARRADEANTAIEGIINNIQSYHSPYWDNTEIALNRYTSFLSQVVQSLQKDADLDLKTGIGSGGGGLANLMKNSALILKYLRDLRAQIGKCDNPNLKAVSEVTAPVIFLEGDTGACELSPASHGNDSGAPFSPPSVNEVSFDQVDVSSWAETRSISHVDADNNTITFTHDASGWPMFDVGEGADHPAFASAWIIVWRSGGWRAFPFTYLTQAQPTSRDVGDVFCGGIGGTQMFGDFVPTAGDTYMFMLSTPARNQTVADNPSNIHERTNIWPYTWPSGINR